MIKEFWKRLTNKRRSNKALTRKEQVLAERSYRLCETIFRSYTKKVWFGTLI